MNDSNHIPENDFLRFKNNLMKQEEMEKFLEHISGCDYCSDQFASAMSEDIILAPRYLKENTLIATRRPEVQIARRAKETSQRMQLFLYSLKVGTATICALILLLLTISFTDIPAAPIMSEKADTELDIINEDNDSLTSVIRDNMDNISNNILDFSNKIMKTEVTEYDQEEE